ncbi:Cerato-platanin-domain-containing protein [Flammula alnicola]|nr:Cerato-platanin-domain-containing protein [Flammula alnicola]
MTLYPWFSSLEDKRRHAVSEFSPTHLTDLVLNQRDTLIKPTMKLTSIFVPLALIPSFISALTVSYDPAYDNAGQSLATVACSDGANGLLTRGFTTFGSLPNFAHIGGAPAVTGWNSPACGTCWQLTYKNAQGVSTSLNITAIDVATPNYNIALSAMNTLTGGQAVALGRVTITAVQVPTTGCGFKS